MGAAGGFLAASLVAAAVVFVVFAVRARRPSAGVVLYSQTHYGGTRAVLGPGTAAPPFQPASVFVPQGLSALLLLTPGVNRVTVGPGSSVSVFTDVQPGTTVSSVTVSTV